MKFMSSTFTAILIIGFGWSPAHADCLSKYQNLLNEENQKRNTLGAAFSLSFLAAPVAFTSAVGVTMSAQKNKARPINFLYQYVYSNENNRDYSVTRIFEDSFYGAGLVSKNLFISENKLVQWLKDADQNELFCKNNLSEVDDLLRYLHNFGLSLDGDIAAQGRQSYEIANNFKSTASGIIQQLDNSPEGRRIADEENLSTSRMTDIISRGIFSGTRLFVSDEFPSQAYSVIKGGNEGGHFLLNRHFVNLLVIDKSTFANVDWKNLHTRELVLAALLKASDISDEQAERIIQKWEKLKASSTEQSPF